MGVQVHVYGLTYNQVVRTPHSHFGLTLHRILPSFFFFGKLVLEILSLDKNLYSFFISCS